MPDAKSEAYELRKLGATPQKNSGRGTHAKGDGILGPFCVDVKEYAKSFGVSRTVWAKLSDDALKSGHLRPMLDIVLGGALEEKMRIVAIEQSMFLEMYEAWREKNGIV